MTSEDTKRVTLSVEYFLLKGVPCVTDCLARIEAALRAALRCDAAKPCSTNAIDATLGFCLIALNRMSSKLSPDSLEYADVQFLAGVAQTLLTQLMVYRVRASMCQPPSRRRREREREREVPWWLKLCGAPAVRD